MLKDKVIGDMRKAIKDRDVDKRDILRVLISEIDRQQTNDDDEIIRVVKKMSDNISQTTNNSVEISILSYYLPQELTEDQMVEILDEVITTEGYTSMKDMGKIMKFFKSDYSSRYDGKLLSQLVKNKFN